MGEPSIVFLGWYWTPGFNRVPNTHSFVLQAGLDKDGGDAGSLPLCAELRQHEPLCTRLGGVSEEIGSPLANRVTVRLLSRLP